MPRVFIRSRRVEGLRPNEAAAPPLPATCHCAACRAALTAYRVAYFAENLKNIETNYVGPGYHYIQEDHPHMIGRELADWLRRQK